jgi:histidyl-tRNA synthetase
MKIPFLIFIGPKEVESGHYTLKNFETTDQVEGLSAQQIADIILKK